MSTNASGAIARDTTSSGIKTNANDAVVSDSANVARRCVRGRISTHTMARESDATVCAACRRFRLVSRLTTTMGGFSHGARADYRVN
jgi:hypothetical protein